MTVPPAGARRSAPPWAAPLRAMDEALQQGQRVVATREWEEVHRAALAAPGWAGLLAAGAARLRLDAGQRDRPTTQAVARRFYFAALFRASQLQDAEGIVAVATAFAELGDRDVIAECLALVSLRPGGHTAQARLRALLLPPPGCPATTLGADPARPAVRHR